MTLAVAIIGAGPAGFYTAEALLQRRGDVLIDIIERLPTPFGLVRTGVAPDHQGTKKVSERFSETGAASFVRFYGNVEVGRDVALDELRQIYDAVVLAIGAPADRKLEIPGEDLPGVYGSSAFVGWYNGHPDFFGLNPSLNTPSAVIIGNGNVALDVARVLVKSPAEMATSDIVEYAAQAIHASPIREVFVLGRRGPLDAKFSSAELREMGHLAGCVPMVDPLSLPGSATNPDDKERRRQERNLGILREFGDRQENEKPKRVHFLFFARPTEILGRGRVEALKLDRDLLMEGKPTGESVTETIACGLIVTAIGYRPASIAGVPVDPGLGLILNEDGRVGERLYAVGWARRGPTGVIGTNKPDGILCAQQINSDCPLGGRAGRAAFERLLAERQVRFVSFADWLTIDAAEVASAVGPAPRHKFFSIEEMLEVLSGGVRSAAQTSRDRP